MILIPLAGAAVGAVVVPLVYLWIILPYSLPQDVDPIFAVGMVACVLRICVVGGGLFGAIVALWLQVRNRKGRGEHARSHTRGE